MKHTERVREWVSVCGDQAVRFKMAESGKEGGKRKIMRAKEIKGENGFQGHCAHFSHQLSPRPRRCLRESPSSSCDAATRGMAGLPGAAEETWPASGQIRKLAALTLLSQRGKRGSSSKASTPF